MIHNTQTITGDNNTLTIIQGATPEIVRALLELLRNYSDIIADLNRRTAEQYAEITDLKIRLLKYE